ncbi:MAG: nucleotidyltransferase domain-containing protein [Oscillospiraceae bacterium]|nr:nucleotidyltransferase domain-containing protein [Oscillospiraceae bacterium]
MISTKKTRTVVLQIAQRFAERVKAEIDTDAIVYLFGSFARGNASDKSDIDMAVISREFGKDISEDYGMLAVIAYQINSDIEAHPIVYDDWVELTPFTIEVRKDGVLV